MRTRLCRANRLMSSRRFSDYWMLSTIWRLDGLRCSAGGAFHGAIVFGRALDRTSPRVQISPEIGWRMISQEITAAFLVRDKTILWRSANHVTCEVIWH